jgi:hypothetical protein
MFRGHKMTEHTHYHAEKLTSVISELKTKYKIFKSLQNF